jgi:hypothetical protein
MRRFMALAVVAVSVGAFAAVGTAQGTAEAPRNATLPTMTGTPALGQTLTAEPGNWTGDPAPTFIYRWQRCNLNGFSCVWIPRATEKTYVVRSADVGRRLRVSVIATNASGTATARSAPGAVVTRTSTPAGTTPLPSGVTSIPATSVALPQRLIIDRVEFSPAPVRSRATPITVRVRVIDTRGYVVRGALVFIRSTPLVTQTPGELATGDDGWATFQVQPEADFPLRRGYAVQFFVRARKTGDNVLAGVSTRRLVQVATAPAA